MNVHWVTKPDAYLEPKIAPFGQGSIPAKTVSQVFLDTVRKHGQRSALHYKAPIYSQVLGQWKVWTWKEYFDDCYSFAKSVCMMKIAPFKIINIMGFNSPEWLIANNGAILACTISAGIYTTNNPAACAYISEHSQAELVVLEGNQQLVKYVNASKALPRLKAIVVWGEAVDASVAANTGVTVYSFADFMKIGEAVEDSVVDERMHIAKPGNCCTLIYTSGTTGNPKAVMISHDNITWTVKTMLDSYVPMNHTDRGVSYLPLSHVAAQAIDIHCCMYLGCSLYFCQTDALKGSLTTTLKEVRPTFFFGVPRVWEKIQEKMVQMGRETHGVLKTISTYAKVLGARHSQMAQYGDSGGAPCCYQIASKLVLNKIKAALGLDAAKVLFSAAAPISVDTLLYFASLDLPVYELFGQSECTGPHTVSAPREWKIGYCGRPMPGTETIVQENSRELCYRGRHVFMGYMYNETQTAETIDNQGYLHSGDVAEFDGNDRPDVPHPSGFMKITGRIKELLITGGGENVAPVLIEDNMKASMIAISNCMVVGDRQKYLCMLVTLKTAVDADTGVPSDALAPDALYVANEIGSSALTVTEAMEDPAWAKYIKEGVALANAKAISNAQIIQKYRILPVDFSEKAGDLTPTLKLKRSVVTAKYQQVIDEMYA